MRKLTQEIFIERSIKAHAETYGYSLVKYEGVGVEVDIICDHHGIFSQTPGHHLRGHGCPKCFGPHLSNNEEFIEKAVKIHGNWYGYSTVKYEKSNIKVDIICPVHGIFSQTPSNHLNGKGCFKCFGSTKLTLDQFVEKYAIIHDFKYSYSKSVYVNAFTKMIITCPDHGDFLQTPTDHSQGKGCLTCANQVPYTFERFVQIANHVHNFRYEYPYTEVTNRNMKIKIICKIHGAFYQRLNQHMTGCGCPKCQNSWKESTWIKSFNNPNILTNQRIYIDGKLFKPDGLDMTTNTIYEFNGDYWHGNPNRFRPEDINKMSEKTFGELYQRTIDKENALKSAGYAIIAIWEQDFDKLFPERPSNQ